MNKSIPKSRRDRGQLRPVHCDVLPIPKRFNRSDVVCNYGPILRILETIPFKILQRPHLIKILFQTNLSEAGI